MAKTLLSINWKFKFFINFFLTLIISNHLRAQDISFGSSGLIGESITNPTSLDYGPDGKLYVSQQNGSIWQFTITRNNAAPGSGTYSVVESNEIEAVKLNTPNHTDDGVTTTIQLRQVTGIKMAGTAENPIIYVTSSDNLIGGGGSGNDKNLDTNSGMLAKLTWNGSSWDKIDLVRGLPRCEENHSTNGMEIFEKNGNTYMLVQQGGHANKGAPSNNFVGTSEYLLSGAILIVNLSQLENMPVYTDPRSNTQYIYDLPTLNDPDREDITNTDNRFPYPSNHPLYNSSIDVGDPFGGNDSLNQAFVEPGGPVQVFSHGYRNAYDVVITQNNRIYTFDNGPNTGWGGVPLIFSVNGIIKDNQNIEDYNPENGDYVTNEFNEAGSAKHGDALHYVGTIDDPNNTYYAGHPIPIAAFPSRADLITYKNINGTWQETSRHTLEDRIEGVSGYFNTSFTMNNFPDDPRLGKYLADAINSDEINILDIVNPSTNGMCEYTASNFDGQMQGDLLAAAFNGNIFRYTLNETGDDDIFKETLFSGFGSNPLDIIALPDGHLYAGSIWAVTYGANNITIFEPNDTINCISIDDPNFDPTADYDFDGYTNQDEIDNNTNFCSGGSTPRDQDQDLVSDLNDLDDDNDGIPDLLDAFAIDPNNGLSTNLPINHSFFNNDPGTGFFGLGFTGLMLDPSGDTDYLTQFDETNISFGGAAGKASVDLIPEGSSYHTLNDQQYGFQFGINVSNTNNTFTVQSRVESPFFGINGESTKPVNGQSVGIFIGTGDQDNYLKVVIDSGTQEDDNLDGIQVLLESNSIITRVNSYDIDDLLTGNAVDIYIEIDPIQNTAQPFVSIDGGITLNQIGNAILLPVDFLDSNEEKALAVGLISSSNGIGGEFSAIWDYMNIQENKSGIISAEPEILDFGDTDLNSDLVQLNLELSNEGAPSDGSITISDLTITGIHADMFSIVETPSLQIGAGSEIIFPVDFTPNNIIGLKEASLEITHTGNNSPLIIPLSAMIRDEFSPIVRINAGGILVEASDEGPDWLPNPEGAISNEVYSVNTGNTASFDVPYENKDVSIPEYIDVATFDALFNNERWDLNTGEEMEFIIPLPNNNYIVNIYLGNGYGGTTEISQRIFNILIEDIIAEENLDLISTFGNQSGGMLSFPVSVTDEELNISFGHIIENPLVNAIEILGTTTEIPELILSNIEDIESTVADIIDFAVVVSGGNPLLNYNYSIQGQPDGISIEPTNGQISGIIENTALDGGVSHDGVHNVTITVSQEGIDPVSTEFIWSISSEPILWIDKNENENYVARHECSFVQAGNKFIMFGGRESAKRLDVYDYTTDTWSLGAEAPLEFNHFQATTYQGLVWIIGAFKDNKFPNETPADYIYMYNPIEEIWIQGIEIPEDRRRGGAGLIVHNDKFYILGGNTIGHNGGYVNWFDEYDPVTGTWTVLPDAPHQRDHFHAAVHDGKIYAAGGRLSGGNGGVFAPLIPEVDIYDFTTNSWNTLTESNNLPTPRAGTSTAVFNNKIVIIGGEGTTSGPAFDKVEAYDPTLGTWETLTSLHHQRHGTQAIVSGEGIYIAGGSPNRGGGNQKNMEVYNKDIPSGEPLIASNFNTNSSTIELVYNSVNETSSIDITFVNTQGTTSTYISSVEISGEAYILSETINDVLVKPGETLNITAILSNTSLPDADALVIVTYDDGQTVDVFIDGIREQTTIFRVNTGGNTVTDTELNWDTDSSSTPSEFVNSQDQNKTYRRVSSSFINNTSYNSSIFFNTRYSTLSVPENMQWDFPVENGEYIVNLLFAEVWPGAQNSGVRIFDILIEENNVEQNFDITDQLGWNTAGIKSYPIEVNDNNLDIDLIKIKQNPSINGIEIIKINTPTNASNIEVVASFFPETDLKVVGKKDIILSPIPTYNQLTIDYNNLKETVHKIEIIHSTTGLTAINATPLSIKNNNKTQIVDVSRLNSGSYTVVLHTENSILTKHFVVF